MSEWVELDNGIRQGDLLSMILYLYYNADMLDITREKNELALGYVDDIALVATAKSVKQAHQAISDMVTHPGGALSWLAQHNSRFEASKSVLMDFTQSKMVTRSQLTLCGTVLMPQPSHKFLRVMMDQELCWQHQASYTVVKASKWILAFCRLARPASGLQAKLMRQLYSTVAIPKLTYMADMWFTPVHKREGHARSSRSVGVTRKISSLQRLVALAITGALRTMATDVLDLHAGSLPVNLLLRKICH